MRLKTEVVGCDRFSDGHIVVPSDYLRACGPPALGLGAYVHHGLVRERTRDAFAALRSHAVAA